jgi:ActR/RegA family two-component response regulator
MLLRSEPSDPTGNRMAAPSLDAGLHGEPEPLNALLLCGDATVPCDALLRTVAAAGVEVVAHEHRWPEAVHLAADLAPDVAIVDLAVAGSAGVRIVSVLHSALPGCEVVVLSPLPELDAAARDAGACEVVRPNDLRPLTAELTRLSAGPRA